MEYPYQLSVVRTYYENPNVVTKKQVYCEYHRTKENAEEEAAYLFNMGSEKPYASIIEFNRILLNPTEKYVQAIFIDDLRVKEGVLV